MIVWFFTLVAMISFVAGATASIVGFGIGSLLTPIVAVRFGTDVAVAVVALPHLAGGLIRGWQLWCFINWRVVVRFGLLSATGGILGAFLFARLAPSVLKPILGVLLVMTAISGITEWTERRIPHGIALWALGALSGFFGGIVGNQGGLRAAMLSTLKLTPVAFVATSTVIGVMVDTVRVPIYLQRASVDLAGLWRLVAVGITGVVAGTLMGDRILLGLSRNSFRIIVSVAIGLLGTWFLLDWV